MSRVLYFVVHNWPLKLGAIALAALLYGGLVLSQTTEDFPGSVPIQVINASSDVIVLSNPGAVTSITYVAPPDLGLRIDSQTFEATVDLEDIDPSGGPVSLSVVVTAIDERVQVLDFEPGQIVLEVDRKGTKTVPITAVLLPLPSGLDAGVPIVQEQSAVITGPASIVSGITEAQAQVGIDASGVDVNQLVNLVAIDGSGSALSPLVSRIEIEPAQVRVRVPVFTDRRSKTVPVRPNVVGTPAAGFEVAAVEVDPALVSIEGDANDLAGLDLADTDPITITGASSEVSQIVGLALPDGVQAPGTISVRVTIHLRPITGTRSFEAGLILVGTRSDRVYDLSTSSVVITIGGSVADLDRLEATTLALTVDVTGLDVGTHTVAVSANLTTGLTLVAVSPNPIQVTVSSPAPSPGSSPGT